MSKKRLDLSKYGTINSDDESHEKIGQYFTQYFRKYNRRMKLYLSDNGCVYQLPCFIFKFSFQECQSYLLEGPVFQRFQAESSNYDISQSIFSILEADQMQERSRLKQIFSVNALEGSSLEWESLKTAYATLIEVTNMQSVQISSSTIFDKLPRSLCDQIESEKIHEMVNSAVDISWKMMTLVPPAFISFPTHFDDELMDRKVAIWDNDKPNCPSVYSQPVLFYSALHQIGQKAAVGNKIDSQRMDIIEVASGDQGNEADDGTRWHRQSLAELDESELFFFCEVCGSYDLGIEGNNRHSRKCNMCEQSTSGSFVLKALCCCLCH